MTKDDIKAKWNELGWVDLPSYVENRRGEGLDIRVPEFNPDVINPRDFWEACEEHFGVDAVSNRVEDVVNGGKGDISQDEADEDNLWIAHVNGASMFLMNLLRNRSRYFARRASDQPHYFKNSPAFTRHTSVLELGPGYGNVKKMIEKSEYGEGCHYMGYDVYPRFPGVKQLGNDCFSEEQMDELMYIRPNFIYCFNVFQHLSIKQVEKYLFQFSQITSKDCGLTLGFCFGTDPTKRITSYLYGQAIELHSRVEIEILLTTYWDVQLYAVNLYSGLPWVVNYCLKPKSLVKTLDTEDSSGKLPSNT